MPSSDIFFKNMAEIVENILWKKIIYIEIRLYKEIEHNCLHSLIIVKLLRHKRLKVA